jgi:uncharacterized membrane protein YidH (DUF202 family)
VGCLVGFNIFIDDVKVGKIKNGEVLTFDVEPGNHTISVNKKNSVNILIDKDTTADVVVFGSNNFGITNINGGTNEYNQDNSVNYLNKSIKNANSTLIFSIILLVLSISMLFIFGFYIKAWVHGIIIGYAIVNIVGLNNLKDTKEYNSLLTKNIISIVVSAVSIVSILFLINL